MAWSPATGPAATSLGSAVSSLPVGLTYNHLGAAEPPDLITGLGFLLPPPPASPSPTRKAVQAPGARRGAVSTKGSCVHAGLKVTRAARHPCPSMPRMGQACSLSPRRPRIKASSKLF